MKKILIILLFILSYASVFAQFEAGEYMNTDTSKIGGTSIIYPSDSALQFHYDLMRDPSEDLDGVNLRTLFARLASLDSLGLIVTDLVAGDTTINSGETQIFFPSAFDSNDVTVVPFVRRISDDAVIDYSINDIDSLGFDIVVWENSIKVSYIASQNISRSSYPFDEPIYSADSAFIKSAIRDLIADTVNYLRAELDPKYAADSAAIKSLDRFYVSDSSEIVHFSDTTSTIGTKTNLLAKIPYIGGTSNVDLGAHNLTVDSPTLFVDATNHRVGIGTITPGGTMSILGAYSSTAPTLKINSNNDAGDYDVFQVWWRNNTKKLIGLRSSTGSNSIMSGVTDIEGLTRLELSSTLTTSSSAINIASQTMTMGVNATGGNTFIDSYNIPLIFGMAGVEKMRISANGNVSIGTTDLDGTPAIGRLTVKGSTNDGSTNAQVWRDSDETNVAWLNTNGGITASYFTSDSTKTGTSLSYVKVDSTGLKMYGNATIFDDILMPFEQGKSGVVDIPAFVPDSMYYTFTTDTTGVNECAVYMTIQFPHGWKEGSTIFPHVHYKHETAVGTPKFKMKYRWIGLTGTTNEAWNWYPMETTTGTTNNTHQMMYNAAGIGGVGKNISSAIFCKIYLGGDPNNVHAYQFDIHIEKDTFGSKTETSK